MFLQSKYALAKISYDENSSNGSGGGYRWHSQVALGRKNKVFAIFIGANLEPIGTKLEPIGSRTVPQFRKIRCRRCSKN